MIRKIVKNKSILLIVISLVIATGVVLAFFILSVGDSEKKSPSINKGGPTEEELAASEAGRQAVAAREGKSYYEVMQEEGSELEKQASAVSKYQTLIFSKKYDEAKSLRSTLDITNYKDEYALSMYTFDTILAKRTNSIEEYKSANELILELDMVKNDEILMNYWNENLKDITGGKFPEDRVVNPEELYSDDE